MPRPPFAPPDLALPGTVGTSAAVAAPWRAELRSPWAWLPPAVAALLLAALAASGADRGLFLWLNRAGRLPGMAAWLHLTLLGDGAVALALVLPCIRRAPRRFWAALIAALIAAAWVQIAKHLVDVPRPLAVFGPAAVLHAEPAHRAGSFPSGHAAAAFALAGIWVMTLRGRLVRLGLLGLATLVALSRVMVGVHWPSDLLGGMLGGWCGAWTGLALAGRRGWHTGGRAAIVAAAALLALCAALLFSRHVGIPSVLPLQRLIGGVCLACGLRELSRMLAARRKHVAQRWPAPVEGRPDG